MSNRRKKQAEPFIQISSVVLNSVAYRDLGFSARSMLVELLHYYNGRNNGFIFISKRVLKTRGFSKNTATKAMKELIGHGFIYMTKRGGNLNGGCSWYAITWLPINRINGQFLESYVPNAYRNWQPPKKNDGAKFVTEQAQNMGLKTNSDLINESEAYLNHSLRLIQEADLNPK